MEGAYVPHSRKIKKINKAAGVTRFNRHAFNIFKTALFTAQSLGADIKFCKRQIRAFTKAMNTGASFSVVAIDEFIRDRVISDYDAFMADFYKRNPYFDRLKSDVLMLNLEVKQGGVEFDSVDCDVMLMSLQSLPECIARGVMSVLLFISRATNLCIMDFDLQCGWIYEFYETEGLRGDEVQELEEWFKEEWSGENEDTTTIELEIPENLKDTYILFRQTYAEFIEEFNDVSQLAAVMSEYVGAKSIYEKAEKLLGGAVDDPYELALLLLSINEGIRSEYKEVIDWLEASADMLMRMNLDKYSASELGCEHGSLLGSEMIALNYEPETEYLLDTVYQDAMNSGCYSCTIDWTSHSDRSAVLSMFPYISIYLALPEQLKIRT